MKTPTLYHGQDGDYLSRWKRILHIDARLRDGSWPPATKLAHECGVSTKSIYRDLDALRAELEAPIVYNATRKGFCYSDPGFAIPAAALSERDLFALMVAENAVAQYEGTPLSEELRSAFAKMLGFLPGEVRARHELAARAVHFAGLPATPMSTKTWSGLTAAIQAREKLDIDYFVPAKGKSETRRVDPYLLVVREREWFLVARTQTNRNYALFYLPRIKKLARTGEFYEVDPEFSAQNYYEHGFNAMHGSGKPETVELYLTPEHAHIADERAWAPRQKIVRRRDGSALLSFRSNALFEVERQILRYGGAVEVLRPASLRNSVHQAALSLAHQHRPKR